MITIENTVTPSPEQWKAIIMGTRNPMNSWGRSDSFCDPVTDNCNDCSDREKCAYIFEQDGKPYRSKIGPNDQDLMMRLAKGGPVHAKYRRMIAVYVTITAPLYWWKEFDTYRVGVAPNPTDIEMNSCSTMHKIHAKEFTLEDFSHEHLLGAAENNLYGTIRCLNYYRDMYLNGGYMYEEDGTRNVFGPKNKDIWWQMIQLLPSSYNQKRTVMLNYEVLANIYKFRKDHKLDEWKEHENIDTETLRKFYDGEFKLRDEKSLNDIGFCDWIKTLPYSELITGEEK